MAEAGFSRVATGIPGRRVILPGRRIIVTALTAALGSGALVGLLMGVVSPSGPPEATAQNAGGSLDTSAPAAAPTGSPTTSAPTSPSSSKTDSPSVSVKTITGTSQPPPTEYIDQPWTQRSLEFANLLDVQRDDRGVTVTLRKAKLLTGDAAHRYQQSKHLELADFAVVPGSGRQSRVGLRDDATLFGEYVLGDHSNVNRHQMNLDEFVGLAQNAISHGEHPTIWIKHSNAIPDSPLVYLAEQYVP